MNKPKTPGYYWLHSRQHKEIVQVIDNGLGQLTYLRHGHEKERTLDIFPDGAPGWRWGNPVEEPSMGVKLRDLREDDDACIPVTDLHLRLGGAPAKSVFMAQLAEDKFLNPLDPEPVLRRQLEEAKAGLLPPGHAVWDLLKLANAYCDTLKNWRHPGPLNWVSDTAFDAPSPRYDWATFVAAQDKFVAAQDKFGARQAGKLGFSRTDWVVARDWVAAGRGLSA